MTKTLKLAGRTDMEGLRNVLRQAERMRGGGERPVLSGVQVGATGGALTAEASNGEWLIRATLDVPKAFVLPPAIWSGETVLEAVAALSDALDHEGATVSLTSVALKVESLGPHEVVRLALVEGQFPNFDEVIQGADPPDDWHFAIDAYYLGKIAALARKHDASIIRVRPGSQYTLPVEFEWRGSGWKVLSLVMPMNVTD